MLERVPRPYIHKVSEKLSEYPDTNVSLVIFLKWQKHEFWGMVLKSVLFVFPYYSLEEGKTQNGGEHEFVHSRCFGFESGHTL